MNVYTIIENMVHGTTDSPVTSHRPKTATGTPYLGQHRVPDLSSNHSLVRRCEGNTRLPKHLAIRSTSRKGAAPPGGGAALLWILSYTWRSLSETSRCHIPPRVSRQFRLTLSIPPSSFGVTDVDPGPRVPKTGASRRCTETAGDSSWAETTLKVQHFCSPYQAVPDKKSSSGIRIGLRGPGECMSTSTIEEALRSTGQG